MKLFRNNTIQSAIMQSLRSGAPEYHSMHIKKVGLYDLRPNYGYYCYVSPSATLAGEVMMNHNVTIFDNAVLRGDINLIRIGPNVCICEGSV